MYFFSLRVAEFFNKIYSDCGIIYCQIVTVSYLMKTFVASEKFQFVM